VLQIDVGVCTAVADINEAEIEEQRWILQIRAFFEVSGDPQWWGARRLVLSYMLIDI